MNKIGCSPILLNLRIIAISQAPGGISNQTIIRDSTRWRSFPPVVGQMQMVQNTKVDGIY
nr:hypothetical protein [Bacteroidota bacterium]